MKNVDRICLFFFRLTVKSSNLQVQQTVFENPADSFKRAWFTLPDSFKIIWNPCQTVLNFFGFLFTPGLSWVLHWSSWERFVRKICHLMLVIMLQKGQLVLTQTHWNRHFLGGRTIIFVWRGFFIKMASIDSKYDSFIHFKIKFNSKDYSKSIYSGIFNSKKLLNNLFS